MVVVDDMLMMTMLRKKNKQKKNEHTKNRCFNQDANGVGITTCRSHPGPNQKQAESRRTLGSDTTIPPYHSPRVWYRMRFIPRINPQLRLFLNRDEN
jgi:hypothetical protein